MACPVCREKAAAVLMPLFLFRRSRWWDRFSVPYEDRRVAGLVKVWFAYDCVCANARCAANYRLTARGSYLLDGARPATKPQPDALARPSLTPEDEEPPTLPFHGLDEDLLVPGERR